jgi:cryptochrome
LAYLDLGPPLRLQSTCWAQSMAVSVRRLFLHAILRSVADCCRLDCQNDLSRSITKLNSKPKLFLIGEAPQTLFPRLFNAWKVRHLVFEKDTDAYARDRDKAVIAAAKDVGFEVIIRPGRTLWDSDVLVEKNYSKPTMCITQVQTAGPKVGPIPRPIAAPKSLPGPGELSPFRARTAFPKA